MTRSPLSVGALTPERFRPGRVNRDQLLLAAKSAVTAGIAWAVALAVHPHSEPYFAPIAVILIIQPTVYDSLSRAFQRIAGVGLGVGLAVAVSHFLSVSAWTIGGIVFVGLILGWLVRLGPQGLVQVPVSALLVSLVGRVNPGYGGARIVDTLIGAAIAVVAVLLSPSAPMPKEVVSVALPPLARCSAILRAMATGISTPWSHVQAETWRQDALGSVDEISAARRNHEAHLLNARWNARAHSERAVLDRAEDALRTAERIAVHTRSIARALLDGAANARPMPGLGEMLDSTATAVDAYAAWVASTDQPADRQRLGDAMRDADATFARSLVRVQERWGNDASRWLTFGLILALSQRILAEISHFAPPRTD